MVFLLSAEVWCFGVFVKPLFITVSTKTIVELSHKNRFLVFLDLLLFVNNLQRIPCHQNCLKRVYGMLILLKSFSLKIICFITA